MVVRRDALSFLQIFVQYLTVCGYIFFVSTPAVALALYYTCIWDPAYVNQHLHQVSNRSNIPPNSPSKFDIQSKPLAVEPSLRIPRDSPCDCPKCQSLAGSEALPKGVLKATSPPPRTTQKVLTF
uniref:Uncharacterized protein n=1 Tax=Bursaphelenchus xylophilus TaxID=6326 RepID=A0A1I7RSH2_BURXY